MNPRHNKKVILLSDFDGTITNKPGGPVVSSDYYKALKTDPNVHYTHATFKSIEELHQIMNDTFTQYAAAHENERDPKRISLEALAFLKEVLTMPEVEIAIITRNKADYIRAMLKFEGINPSIVDNLSIYELTPKDKAAKDFLKDYHPRAVLGFDDDEGDAKKIKDGAEAAVNTDQVDVMVFSEKPGKFNWDQYLQIIKQKLQLTSSPRLFPAKQNSIENNESEEVKLDQKSVGFTNQ